MYGMKPIIVLLFVVTAACSLAQAEKPHSLEDVDQNTHLHTNSVEYSKEEPQQDRQQQDTTQTQIEEQDTPEEEQQTDPEEQQDTEQEDGSEEDLEQETHQEEQEEEVNQEELEQEIDEQEEGDQKEEQEEQKEEPSKEDQITEEQEQPEAETQENDQVEEQEEQEDNDVSEDEEQEVDKDEQKDEKEQESEEEHTDQQSQSSSSGGSGGTEEAATAGSQVTAVIAAVTTAGVGLVTAAIVAVTRKKSKANTATSKDDSNQEQEHHSEEQTSETVESVEDQAKDDDIVKEEVIKDESDEEYKAEAEIDTSIMTERTSEKHDSVEGEIIEQLGKVESAQDNPDDILVVKGESDAVDKQDEEDGRVDNEISHQIAESKKTEDIQPIDSPIEEEIKLVDSLMVEASRADTDKEIDRKQEATESQAVEICQVVESQISEESKSLDSQSAEEGKLVDCQLAEKSESVDRQPLEDCKADGGQTEECKLYDSEPVEICNPVDIQAVEGSSLADSPTVEESKPSNSQIEGCKSEDNPTTTLEENQPVDSQTAKKESADNQTDKDELVDSQTDKEEVVDSQTDEVEVVDSQIDNEKVVDSQTAEEGLVDSDTAREEVAEEVLVDSLAAKEEVVDSYTAEKESVDSQTAKELLVDNQTVEQSPEDIERAEADSVDILSSVEYTSADRPIPDEAAEEIKPETQGEGHLTDGSTDTNSLTTKSDPGKPDIISEANEQVVADEEIKPQIVPVLAATVAAVNEDVIGARHDAANAVNEHHEEEAISAQGDTQAASLLASIEACIQVEPQVEDGIDGQKDEKAANDGYQDDVVLEATECIKSEAAPVSSGMSPMDAEKEMRMETEMAAATPSTSKDEDDDGDEDWELVDREEMEKAPSIEMGAQPPAEEVNTAVVNSYVQNIITDAYHQIEEDEKKEEKDDTTSDENTDDSEDGYHASRSDDSSDSDGRDGNPGNKDAAPDADADADEGDRRSDGNDEKRPPDDKNKGDVPDANQASDIKSIQLQMLGVQQLEMLSHQNGMVEDAEIDHEAVASYVNGVVESAGAIVYAQASDTICDLIDGNQDIPLHNGKLHACSSCESIVDSDEDKRSIGSSSDVDGDAIVKDVERVQPEDEDNIIPDSPPTCTSSPKSLLGVDASGRHQVNANSTSIPEVYVNGVSNGESRGASPTGSCSPPCSPKNISSISSSRDGSDEEGVVPDSGVCSMDTSFRSIHGTPPLETITPVRREVPNETTVAAGFWGNVVFLERCDIDVRILKRKKPDVTVSAMSQSVEEINGAIYVWVLISSTSTKHNINMPARSAYKAVKNEHTFLLGKEAVRETGNPSTWKRGKTLVAEYGISQTYPPSIGENGEVEAPGDEDMDFVQRLEMPGQGSVSKAWLRLATHDRCSDCIKRIQDVAMATHHEELSTPEFFTSLKKSFFDEMDTIFPVETTAFSVNCS